ncbi:hypothetical protein E4U55_001499 [Claviceps digitariae]|nr:hypothetical protein E4U55_001499 [Claviceps digitariae]
MRNTAFSLFVATAWYCTAAVAVDSTQDSPANCRVLPGDPTWPSKSDWYAFNSSVDGQLIATKPLGSPCHDPKYDETACAAVQKQWMLPQFHIQSSSSIMSPFFANQSCDPFTPRKRPCTLGNYVSYAVNATSSAHVAKTIVFARKHNIRITVRHTGHDYFGRSTAAGGLAIWVHALKQADIVDWADEVYTGQALQAGAGVLGVEAIEAANAKNLVVITGECPSVGLAGGFTQGGGHSALSTSFGMAADQVLKYEVVTADGRTVEASPKTNRDLYWALSGGGGGTFGVVTSITVRAYPGGSVGGGFLAFNLQSTTRDKFDQAVSKFHAQLPAMIDHGVSLSYVLTSAAFQIGSITAFNSTGEFVRDTVMGPFMKVLSDLAIPAWSSFTTLSYRDHYDRYMGPLPNGHLAVSAFQFGGRLIPRSTVQKNNPSLQAALRNVTTQGVIAVGTASSWAAPPHTPSNAVFPAWRKALIQLQLVTPWDPTDWAKMLADQKRMTNEFVPQFAAITPGSGAYLNEADTNEPHWQETFFGANYKALLATKKKWDPQNVFYVFKGVGSEAWTVDVDGRMCRAKL